MNHLDDIKHETVRLEKSRLENISKTEEAKNNINEIESASEELKEMIENAISEITGTKYTLI